RDGGTLQVGIGEMGDAMGYALLLRHQQNALWRTTLAALAPPSAAHAAGGDAPLSAGLFASSGVFVDALLELYRAGVLRRRVYDCLPLERLLARGGGERFGAEILAELAACGAGPQLSAQEFATLRHYGVFREEVEYRDGRMRARDGEWLAADLADPAARARPPAQGPRRALRHRHVAPAGLLLAPPR